jgi:hypothetical protein
MIQQLHLITPFANEHKRQLRQDNLDRGRVSLANMQCKVSLGGSEIMPRHAAML